VEGPLSATAPPVRLLLDTDTGVDDAVAILYALGAPEAELVALTGVAGNVGVDEVTRNNLALLALCGHDDIEVARGAGRPLVAAPITASSHGPEGLGYARIPDAQDAPSSCSAAERLVAHSRAAPGELVLVATGPLTNIALALRLDPELPRRLRRLVIMGGAFHRNGNVSATAEFNIAADPEAAKIVFDAFAADDTGTLPLICPLNVTETVGLRPEHLARLGRVVGEPVDAATMTAPATGNPVIRMLFDALRFHMEAYERGGYGYLAHMHDPLAVALALEPELADVRPAAVDVELVGQLTRGTTIADFRGLWGRAPNVEIALSVDPEAVLERIIACLATAARIAT
jgi:purine nucleosidase